MQSRLVDHANFMSSGFDHTSQLAFSHNAAAGRLLGLSEQQIGHAIAMAAVSDASFAVVRAKPLSQWKGLASSQSALGAMNSLFLARRGVQGPLQVIEGPLGIDHLLRMKINIDWDKQGYEGVVAVSYTHLDVYKRQGMEGVKWRHSEPLHRAPILRVPKRCWIAQVAGFRRCHI